MGKASREKKTRPDDPRPRPTRGLPPVTRVELVKDDTAAWTPWVAALSLIVLAVLIYIPCLSGQFVFDDHNAILQSLLVREIWPLTRFLTHSNRPLMDFSYAINFWLGGGYDVYWFHLTNIILHAASTVVLYLLASRTLRLPRFKDRYAESSHTIAWIAAALFACHPLASETVAYIASRSEGLAALFYLTTLLTYSVAVTSSSSSARSYAKYAIPFTTALALGSKEIAATLPIALVLYDFVFIAAGDFRSTRLRLSLLAYSTIPIAAGGLYFILRALVSGSVGTPYQQSAGFGFDRYTPLQYLSTQFGVLVHYLRVSVVPTGLHFDHDWKLSTSLFQIRPLLSLAALIGLGLAALKSLRSHPFFAFAVGFFFLVLAPTSSIMPLADLAVERRMYIPLAGLMLFGATAAADALRGLAGDRAKTVLAVLALVVIAIFSGLTYQRATLWGDDVALHEDGIAKAPGSPRVRLNLGVIHLNSGRYVEAHDVLFEAKKIYDEGKSIHAFPRIGAFINYNLGAIQFIREEFEDSERYMRDALSIGGHYVALRPRAYSVLGHIFKMRGEWDAAEESFREALKYNRDFPEWMHALAEVLYQQGKFKESKQTLFQLHHSHPEYRESAESKRQRSQLAQQHMKTMAKKRRTARQAGKLPNSQPASPNVEQ